MKGFFSLLFTIGLFLVHSQQQYFVQFKQKDLSAFSVDKPYEFLSQNAIERRLFFSIPIDESDLPVVANYIQAIKNLDAQYIKQSKWLNGIVVVSSNPNFEEEANALSIVKQVINITPNPTKSIQNKFEIDGLAATDMYTETDYGYMYTAVNMLNGQFLHNLGFTGSSMQIAVMDEGFAYVDSNRFFDTAIIQNRIMSGYNFVNNSTDVFSFGNHGAMVLSTLCANIKDTLIGTAPNANYYLFTTEDANNEGIPEEINWAMAAEWADSALGTHIVLSTSLGYSNGFNDPSTEHVYADMDGNTTIITQAADLAARKGMLVVNSAGNEGNNAWHYITAPADGDSVFTIGAVKADGVISEFSSYGPTADGRIKPNVSAQGQSVVVADPGETLMAVSGTSFSCPIMAGMSACLWEAFPDKSNMEIIQAIEESASMYGNPNERYGYGIPNFEWAYYILKAESNAAIGENLLVFPNPATDFAFVLFKNESGVEFTITVSDANGQMVLNEKSSTKTFYKLNVFDWQRGVYFIQIQQGKQKFRAKFVKG